MPKDRVAYYYHTDIGNYYYGPGHPMKPHRLKLTHHLIKAYGLYRKMECYRPRFATAEELSRFHSDDYVDFLRRVTPENCKALTTQMQKYSIGEYTDCPVFDGLYRFCQAFAGGSIDAAGRLNHGQADVAINWAGGLHHAKKCEASGFCYVNDIVLAILELLKYHQRVLYLDIDVHHGDGVEEAFYTTDRVMTVSFHKFGDFFPGTGAMRDTGARAGKGYSVNVPLNDGIDDSSYESIFKPIMARVMEMYRPNAVVLQCGADSLTGDRLGVFNLTLRGHAECVKYIRAFGVPTVVLGGGGYTIRNVARCWAFETATVLGEDLPDYIPPNEYVEFYRPDYRLHLDPAPSDNLNSPDYLDKCRAIVLENLRGLAAAPSVQFQAVPPDWALREAEEEEDEATLRAGARGGAGGSGRSGPRADAAGLGLGGGGAGFATGAVDGRRSHEAEFYDGDEDGDAGGRRGGEGRIGAAGGGALLLPPLLPPTAAAVAAERAVVLAATMLDDEGGEAEPSAAAASPALVPAPAPPVAAAAASEGPPAPAPGVGVAPLAAALAVAKAVDESAAAAVAVSAAVATPAESLAAVEVPVGAADSGSAAGPTAAAAAGADSVDPPQDAVPSAESRGGGGEADMDCGDADMDVAD